MPLGNGARCLGVWLGGTLLLVPVVALARPTAYAVTRGPLAALPLDRALAGACAVALLLCAGWAWVALTVTVVEARRGVAGSRATWRLPRGLRRAVWAACGVALVAGTAAPALAGGGGYAVHGVARLDGLPLPDRAVAPRVHHAPRRRPESSVVVVRPGDCLWTIAARRLPAGASAAQVDAAWRALYAANRAAIGPDPDRLPVGLRLHLPRKEPR